MTHYLTPIESDSLPSQCIVMDSEISTLRAMGDQQGTYYANLVRGTRWRYEDGRKFRHAESASLLPANWWDWVAKQCRAGTVTWLFAYDLLRQLRCNGFLDLLTQGDWKLTTIGEDDGNGGKSNWNGFAVLADPPTILIVRPAGRRGTLKMVDLRNYGVGKREDIGGTLDFVSNVEGWVTNVIDWIRGNRLGALQCTAGSQGLHSYRRRFLDESLLCHESGEAHTIETGSFYGGRCEVYRIGQLSGPIYHLDANSLYPAACIDLALPIELLRVREKRDWIDPLSLAGDMGCIAEVRIVTDEPLYPVRRNGLVIYPVGDFWTTLAGPELTDACVFGHVQQFGNMAEYRCEPILHDYMEWLYGERMKAKQRGDVATEGLIKRMLVGLPGKFIQQDRKWMADRTRKATVPWRVWRELDADLHEVNQYRAFGWQVQREQVGGFAKHALPAIGAWITSAARVLMRDFFDVVPQGSLFYTDTDSLWVDSLGFTALCDAGYVNGEQMGKLKVVECHKTVEFRGIKNYIADGRIVRAGIGGIVSAPSHGRQGNPDFRPVNADLAFGNPPQPIDIESRPDDRPIYRHGIVGEDGWVKPFRLGGKPCQTT